MSSTISPDSHHSWLGDVFIRFNENNNYHVIDDILPRIHEVNTNCLETVIYVTVSMNDPQPHVAVLGLCHWI